MLQSYIDIKHSGSDAVLAF